MGNYKSSKAVLYTTVSLSAIILNTVSFQSAIAEQIIEYTGTQEQYDALEPVGVILPNELSNNKIIISGPNDDSFRALKEVNGGYYVGTDNVTISGNSVYIYGGTINNNDGGSGNVVGGGGASSGALNFINNLVNISDGTITGYVIGGGNVRGDGKTAMGDVDVSNNRIVVSGGEIGGDLYAGSGMSTSTAAVHVSKNSIFVSGGEIRGNVYAGLSSIQGSAPNKVTMSDNSIVVENGKIDGEIYGAAAAGHGGVTISGNSVDISGGTIGKQVFGGFGGSSDTLTISDNHVFISNVTIKDQVFGGNTFQGNRSNAVEVSGNSVTLKGGKIESFVFGGRSEGSKTVTVSDNRVLVTDGEIDKTVTAGLGSGLDSASIFGNSVVVKGGTIKEGVVGGAGGSGGAVTISGNSVDISGGTITGGIYAAFSETVPGLNTSGAVTISDNSVKISGGTVSGNVYGGYSEIKFDEDKKHGEIRVISNTVTLESDKKIDGSVYGGYAKNILDNKIGQLRTVAFSFDTDATSLSSGAVTISDNHVKISSGTISGNVYGGYSEINSGQDQNYGKLRVINNTVTLEPDAKIIGAVYGGYAKDNFGSEITEFNTVVSGNTLNLNNYRGSLAGIYNFENYNWVLPKNIAANDTIISITGDTPVDLSNTKHTTAIESGSQRLKVGDQITLISKATADTIEVPLHVNAEMEQGHFIIYDVDMKVDDNNEFVLKIKGDNDAPPPDGDKEDAGRINPRTKALSEGRAAALGFLSQGSDLIATAGIDNIRIMVQANDTEKHIPFLPFLITKGSSNRYDTGSHVDVNGFHMALGIASGAELEQGHKATLGAFFEYGRGTYDTYNSFANYASVKGDGDTHYTGGGIFGRFEFAGTGLGYVADLAPTQADGLYLEASLRAGRVSMGFDSNDLVDWEGYRGSYDSKSNYWGGHAAAGYVLNFDERQSLDVYGRYLWTHMNSDSVTVGNDRLHFDSATSNRLQIGGRYNYAYSDQFKPYIGAAYEYEFSGGVGASAYNLRLDEPSLKGSTGIIEAGFSFTPNVKVPDFSINVTAQGFFGQRRGGSGEMKIKYQF